MPDWLLERLQEAGGAVHFRTYMEWALHDPQWGAYGNGRLRIGPGGDFVTSPSLGIDFAELLAPQVLAWLHQSAPEQAGPLGLVETGPGEGVLALDLCRALHRSAPELGERLEIVLVEPNRGMEARQRQRLRDAPLPVRWSTLEALAAAPVTGILLAHEVLDALAIDRVIWDGRDWRHQLVALDGDPGGRPTLRLQAGAPLDPQEDGALFQQLELRGLLRSELPAAARPVGWTTELHRGNASWLASAAAALAQGTLLVVDYALEARRYNALQRSNGTLMAYRGQVASADPLQDPGQWDLTAHLCIETLIHDATGNGWRPIGQRRQGEALLALGLAERLHRLQHLPPQELSTALAAREALLRLVDPAALGDFRWLAFRRDAGSASASRPTAGSNQPERDGIAAADLFLHDPPLS
ncbi:MAG: class I SAM-dependent methyltransferase [Cyanobacteriota bacterium]